MAGKPKPPTLKHQIESAEAPKGSALEKLIRANQDFDLLHPDEFEDAYPVPLWLRVAWRKQHPEVQLPAKNPGAAYPEVLSQAYRRMVANPNDAWGPDAAAAGGDG
jgi:hypothetical protein